MKKILLILMILTTMMMSVCFASDGNDLDREQQAVQGLMNVFENKNVPTYTVITRDFAPSLKENMNETAYENLQKEIQDKLGTMQEVKFYTYQRFDQGDRLTYIASFAKEPMVAIVFLFDKDKKMINFAVSPLQQQEQTAQ